MGTVYNEAQTTSLYLIKGKYKAYIFQDVDQIVLTHIVDGKTVECANLPYSNIRQFTECMEKAWEMIKEKSKQYPDYIDDKDVTVEVLGSSPFAINVREFIQGMGRWNLLDKREGDSLELYHKAEHYNKYVVHLIPDDEMLRENPLYVAVVVNGTTYVPLVHYSYINYDGEKQFSFI